MRFLAVVRDENLTCKKVWSPLNQVDIEGLSRLFFIVTTVFLRAMLFFSAWNEELNFFSDG